jgi:hypothetical protein
MSKKDMDYVIARRWEPEDPESSLCIYTYGSEIQRGTLKDAKDMLAYVKRQSKRDGDPHKEYSIYEVAFRKLAP